MIELKSASKIYSHRGKDVAALFNVDLTVKKGEFATIVGPSGSGKTTLLLMMGGLVHPSEGKVFVDGNSIYELPVRKRAELRLKQMGFLFQTFNLVPYLTAMENVSVPLYLAGKLPEEQRVKASELLKTFGLGERLDHKPSELSAGQQQRVALARTLANDPELILADEPTGNLDPGMTEDLISAFKELNAKGKTIVMVTHNYHVAEQGTKRLLLENGKVSDK